MPDSHTSATTPIETKIPATAQDSSGTTELGVGEKWGLEIQSIRLTAGGYMLDFRYRVVETEKAAPLFGHKVKPYLIDQASGVKMAVPSPPKVGPLRPAEPPQKGRIYFILFANPGRFIKKGNKVTVVIGDLRAENLIVE